VCRYHMFVREGRAMISRDGTFKYYATIPERPESEPMPPLLQLSEVVDGAGRSGDTARLVGFAPCLRISDGGPIPSAHPAFTRSRFTLIALEQRGASASSASFHVESNLARALRPGDILHLARTRCGGLGVSLLRANDLVFAVGAILSVPLGNGIHAETPHKLVNDAEAPFKTRDPDFKFHEFPLQLNIGGQLRITFGGRLRMGNYDIWVGHGFQWGLPGVDECAAISLRGIYGCVPASLSAQMLESGKLEITGW
jgi:hypothetical protein